MKKICSIVKVAAISIVIGETIASYYKNNDFKSKLEKSKWFDKCRTIFDNLLEINKRFFTEVSSFDYDSKYKEFKTFAEEKYSELNTNLDEIKKNLWNFNQEKLTPILKDLNDKATDLRKKAETEITSLSDKLELERKFDAVKSKIEDIRKKIQK